MSDTPENQSQHPSLSSFQSFALSLASSAMIHLGEIPDPETRQARMNLNLAKATIETLEMLAEKTRGNLNADEEKTLSGVLSELRLRYVSAKEKTS